MNGQLRDLAAFIENSQKDRLHRSQPLQATHLTCHQLLDPGVGLNLGLRREGEFSLIWNRVDESPRWRTCDTAKAEVFDYEVRLEARPLGDRPVQPAQAGKEGRAEPPRFFGGPNS